MRSAESACSRLWGGIFLLVGTFSFFKGGEHIFSTVGVMVSQALSILSPAPRLFFNTTMLMFGHALFTSFWDEVLLARSVLAILF